MFNSSRDGGRVGIRVIWLLSRFSFFRTVKFCVKEKYTSKRDKQFDKNKTNQLSVHNFVHHFDFTAKHQMKELLFCESLPCHFSWFIFSKTTVGGFSFFFFFFCGDGSGGLCVRESRGHDLLQYSSSQSISPLSLWWGEEKMVKINYSKYNFLSFLTLLASVYQWSRVMIGQRRVVASVWLGWDYGLRSVESFT